MRETINMVAVFIGLLGAASITEIGVTVPAILTLIIGACGFWRIIKDYEFEKAMYRQLDSDDINAAFDRFERERRPQIDHSGNDKRVSGE